MKTFEIWLIQHIGRVGAFIVSATLRGILWASAIVAGICIVWLTGAIVVPMRAEESKELVPVAQFLMGLSVWFVLFLFAGMFWFMFVSPLWDKWNEQYPEQKDKP